MAAQRDWLGPKQGAGLNVVTLEDPIEYRIAGLQQSQIDTERGFTFAEGLKGVQMPDFGNMDSVFQGLGDILGGLFGGKGGVPTSQGM